MRRRWVGLAVLASLTAPVGAPWAEQGFSFRPDSVEVAPVTPGWQVTPGAPSAGQGDPRPQGQEGYRFAPQAPGSASEPPAIGQRSDTATYPNYRYKPEEELGPMAQPAPLPKAGAPSNPLPPIPGYGVQQQGPPQASTPGGAPPWTSQPPPPGFAPPTVGSIPETRPPQPMQPPLRLENRYIDGAAQYANSYPFRPLEDEARPQRQEKPTPPAQPAAPAAGAAYPQHPYNANAYAYPGAPAVPGYGYGHYPYNNYNSGPSFGGFRFPFSNGGGFPFGFK